MKITASTFIILALFASACQAEDRIAEPSALSMLNNTATQTLVPAPSATTTSTLEPTQTATLMPEPSITPTPTLVPTLPVEAANSRILELIETNEGCEIPCLWGITPGKSTLREIWEKLLPLSGISNTKYLSPVEKGTIIINYPADDLEIGLYLEYYPAPGTKSIELIFMSTQAFQEYEEKSFTRIYNAASYSQIFHAYSLSNVLSTFGPPSEVKVFADILHGPSPEQMRITLLYPVRGFLIRYLMNGERRGSLFIGDPSKAFIDLWLFSPDVGDKFYELDSLREDWETDLSHGKSLEESFQMTLDEFYQAFKEPRGQLLQTPLDIWPNN